MQELGDLQAAGSGSTHRYHLSGSNGSWLVDHGPASDRIVPFLSRLASRPPVESLPTLRHGGCTVASLQDAAVLDAGDADGGLADLCSRAVPYKRIESCTLVTADGGEAVHVVYTDYCVGGRRPAGLVTPAGLARTSPLGAWLAGMAHLEAASVEAFGILANELEFHGASPALARTARASAEDERRHARLMARLALASGARPLAVRVARHAPRDLETVARENATGGCVREAFAALVAWRQARMATEPSIRETMGCIAADETRHAALSWAIDAWSRDGLPATALRRVRGARNDAIAHLLRDVAVEQPPALRLPAGLPDGDEAVAMASALFARLA
jgi:hypothetical protein